MRKDHISYQALTAELSHHISNSLVMGAGFEPASLA